MASHWLAARSPSIHPSTRGELGVQAGEERNVISAAVGLYVGQLGQAACREPARERRRRLGRYARPVHEPNHSRTPGWLE